MRFASGPAPARLSRRPARDIPVRRLNADSLVQLGYGVKLRRIQAAETDRTGAIAEPIAQDKELTRTLLKAVGVPVPEGRPVTDADDAWLAACDIGVPVVVKPRDGNQGRGVATNLTTREQILAAYQAALAESKQVVVEKFAPGHDYRAAGRRRQGRGGGPPRAGPGAGRRHRGRFANWSTRSISTRAAASTTPPCLSKIKLDAVALGVLADQGYTPDSVAARRHRGPHSPQRQPEHRRHGDRRDRAGPSAGCSPRHRAAQVVGLDIAGVDVVATDISAPLEEQGGVVVEVNAAPGLRMHLQPSVGISRPVGEAIVSTLFPAATTGGFPSPR